MDIWKSVSWEVMIYAQYIARDNPSLFSDKAIKKHGRKALSQALIEGSHFMAKVKAKANGNSNYTPVTWVNYSLSDENIAEIEGWDVDDGELLAALISAVDTGHSLTIKAANDGDGFMAALTGVDDDCPNKGLGISAYAADARSAAKVLVFKHIGVFSGIWPKSDGSSKPKYR